MEIGNNRDREKRRGILEMVEKMNGNGGVVKGMGRILVKVGMILSGLLGKVMGVRSRIIRRVGEFDKYVN
ncbi:hypothetical protein, partial [Staphylococcus hominis]|uniref:hypothetical protein n=1 Tax=Staphylococcus hominis TaxID=1290 RepID=UPI001C92D3DF